MMIITITDILSFKKMGVIRRIVKQYADNQMQLDFRSDTHSQFLKIVMKLLKEALGQRVSRIFGRIEPLNLVWSVSEKMPRHTNVLIGFSLDPEYAFNIIDKGPVANLPEVAI